jgi:hypothetical protein
MPAGADAMVIEVCRWLLLGVEWMLATARRAGDDFHMKKWDLSEV